ncbi:hypothetical protein EV714DRAFT_198940 [Schizophyllum commune]
MSFSDLPVSLQRRIDKAFRKHANRNGDTTSNDEPARKKRRLDEDTGGGFISDAAYEGGGGFIPEEGGGFLVEDDADEGGGFVPEGTPAEGGGFIVEDDTNKGAANVATQIALSAVPAALQDLDLPPSDEEVLSVFRNAASGWSASSSAEAASHDDAVVSLDDWRTVCAVLLEHRAEEYEESDDVIPGEEAMDEDVDVRMSDDESDEYQAKEDSDSGSDDEYVEEPSSKGKQKSRRMRKRGRRSSSLSSLSEDDVRPKTVTARQKQTCLKAYSLFFPDVAERELPNQRVMLKDIQRVAKLLGEKIKAEEMVEMLEMFSTVPDKSMGLSDFERMMITAKLA